MTARRQWTIVLIILVLLGGGLAAATHYLGDELFPVTLGSRAPDFHAATLGPAPQTKTLDDYRGDVVVLNIWATWCVPCQVEMPSLEKLHQAMGPRGLKIVAVSVDDPGPGVDQRIRDFAARYGLTFQILHEGTGKIEKLYQTTGYPETFVIGRDGVIRKKVIGASDWNSDGHRLAGQLIAQKLCGDVLAR